MKKKILKSSIYSILLSLFAMMTSSDIFAHKVIIFAYVEGDTVYTESYFPDGGKVKGGTIVVHDSQGNKLLEGKSDKDGLFNFKLPKKGDLKIILNASLGHKNSYTLSAGEIPEITEEPEKSSSRKALVEQKKFSLTEVIGGIGYIFGIMGVMMYFLSRKRRDKKDAPTGD